MFGLPLQARKIVGQKTLHLLYCDDIYERIENIVVHSNDVVLKDNVHGKVSKILFLVRKQNKTRIFEH